MWRGVLIIAGVTRTMPHALRAIDGDYDGRRAGDDRRVRRRPAGRGPDGAECADVAGQRSCRGEFPVGRPRSLLRLCPECGKRSALLARKYFPLWKIVVTFLSDSPTTQQAEAGVLGPAVGEGRDRETDDCST